MLAVNVQKALLEDVQLTKYPSINYGSAETIIPTSTAGLFLDLNIDKSHCSQSSCIVLTVNASLTVQRVQEGHF
jgi:hypothetical protein